MLNILANYNGHAVILFTIIMTARKVALYKKVFDFIKLHYPAFSPKQMTSDFEGSLRKAFISRFPLARLYGCR